MKEIALYVHIPFCKQKCLYCDFPSYAGKENLKREYIKALKLEIEAKCKDKIIKTLFIGGGTPSYLNEEELEILFTAINNLTFTKNAEKTIECNPGTLSEEKLNIIKNNGINRISIGLQTTNNNLLKDIGRIHTIEEFKENYLLARKLGFNNINVDLMFGLPNQSVNELELTLQEIIKLDPEHISLYSLIIEEGTSFYSLYNKGLLKLPTEDDEREMYNLGKKILEKNGYHQYEISNYAKDNRECEHNKIYWRCEEYIGVGTSASSFIDGFRIKNIDNIEEYINSINSGKDVIEEKIKNDKKATIEEFIFLGLRLTVGINKEEFKERFNVEIEELYGSVIERNIYKQLLEDKDGYIKLTKKGIEVSNYVMSEFI